MGRSWEESIGSFRESLQMRQALFRVVVIHQAVEALYKAFVDLDDLVRCRVWMGAWVAEWWSGARFVPALRSDAVLCCRLSFLRGSRVGPNRGLHHFVKSGGHFGVSRLSSFNVGRVGRVVRAALGACSCLWCWRIWWRSVAVCSHAYHLECALQSDRVVKSAIWSARAVVGLVGWWAFVSAACCRVCVSERVW